MIPEHSALGSLAETPTKWFRPAQTYLTDDIVLDICSLDSNISVGWCVKEFGAHILTR